MSTITLGANVDFHGKVIRGDTYQHTSSANTPAAWGTLASSALDQDLKTAIGSICSAVDLKMTGTLQTGNTVVDGSTSIPNSEQVHTFVTGQNYLTAHQSLAAYAKKDDDTQTIIANNVKADTKMELPELLPYNTSNGLTIGETGNSKCHIEVKDTTVKVIGKDSSGNATTLITFTAG